MNCLFIFGYVSSAFVRALCWTLLHSLWQGLIAAAVAGLIIMGTRHSKAALRYNLLSIVFISFIVCSLFTFLFQPGIINESLNRKVYTSSSSIANSYAINDPEKHWIPAIEKNTFFQPVIYYGNKYSAFITGIWAIFFFANFLRMLSGLRQAYRLRNLDTFVPAQEWKERLYTLSSLVGIHSKVLLKESAVIKVPVLVGFLKPVILVPIGMFANLSVEQVETIFVHELAHIRRKDFAVNLLQRFAESIFFFNPFVVWVSSLIREEREACCDDIVLEYTSDKKSYLEALVSFQVNEYTHYDHVMALGGSNSLLNRAKRILTNENKKLNAMEKLTLILVVLAVTAFGFIPEKKDKPVKQQIAKHLPSPVSIVKKTPESHRPFVVSQKSIASVKDTVPASSVTFKNISSSISDDGTDKTIEVKALGSDTKKYSYKIVNDEIKEFSIDGVSVGKENFKNYEPVVNEIEDGRELSVLASLHKQEGTLTLLQNKQQLMKQQQSELLNEIAKTDSKINLVPQAKLLLLKTQQDDLLNKMDLQENNLILQNDKLELLKTQQDHFQKENQLQLENKLNLLTETQSADNLQLLKEQTFKLEKPLTLSSIQAVPMVQPVFTNGDIAGIINNLYDAGVIDDKKQLSFTLNYDELIVNGKKQNAGLHEKLKAKYVTGRKDHYIYKTNGHSTSTDIVKE